MRRKKRIRRISVSKLTKAELLERGVEDEAGWWIQDNNNDPESQLVGPYSTKAEAQEGKRGLEDTWRNWEC